MRKTIDDGKEKGYVYLLCFRRADGSKGRYRHAGHYLGWARLIRRRVTHHKAGRGAKLTRAAVDAGLVLRIARAWKGVTRDDERALKKGKSVARLCPLCHDRARYWGAKVGKDYPV